jgi:ubiquinone/menaquinone biosynthesis C-methylase UbiE
MSSFDEAWQRTYLEGQQLNKYPWSDVVSFVFRNRPRDLANAEISVLEVGCGSGPNLMFLAAEGFRTFGLEASPAAVEVAKQRLSAKNLAAEVVVGDFTRLPFDDDSLDLVIDRAAVTHADAPSIDKAVREIHRVLKPGGKFLFTPFGDSHSGFAYGTLGTDGTSSAITKTHLAGFQVTFFNATTITRLFADGWRLLQCTRREEIDMLDPSTAFASWLVVAQKI